MIVLALTGLPNVGKTTTMNIVYALLSPFGIIEKGNERKALGDDFKDFSCILTYKGKKIAINSMGDILGETQNFINESDKKRCDICLCTLSKNDKCPQYKIKAFCKGKYRYATVDMFEHKNMEREANIYYAHRVLHDLDYFISNYNEEDIKK